MVSITIYILATIIGSALGIFILGFLYYRRKYRDIKSKYDSLGGDDCLSVKSELEDLYNENEMLLKENDKLRSKQAKRSRRKGLHKRVLNRTHDNHQIHVECEVVEVDRARGKSKIEVVHINCQELLSDAQRQNVTELVEGWLDSKEVEWFEKPLDEVRDEKIDEILEE